MNQVPIAGRRWLREDAAASWSRMRADGCPDGGVTDAGRTFAEQSEMYRLFLAGKLRATAARPGTSKHESGRALDLAGGTRAWVRRHGHVYGWMRDRVARELWHMEYEPWRDPVVLTAARRPPVIAAAPAAPITAAPTPPPAPLDPKEREDMRVIHNIETGAWFQTDGNTWLAIGDPADAELLGRIWSVVDLTTEQCNRLVRRVQAAQAQLDGAVD